MVIRLRGIYRAIAHRFNRIGRSRSIRRVRRRWLAKSPHEFKPSAKTGMSKATDRITTRVINLEKRRDRLEQISVALMRVGIRDWEHLRAIDGIELNPNLSTILAGSIGCEASHIEAISRRIGPHIEAIMVCEDDLEFSCSQQELDLVISEFLEDERLDVLSLSGRPRGGSFPISDNLRVVIGLVGRGCYILKPHMVQPLLKIFSDGLSKLAAGNLEGKGDLEWRKAQLEDYFFAFPRTDLAYQSAGFSDIEGKLLGPR